MTQARAGVARPLAAAIAVTGLAVSAALLVDSLGPGPAFCAASGCDAVRETAWSRPLGVPLPFLGLAHFGLLLALVLAGPRAARARRVVAVVGGLGALGLLGLQAFVIGSWCRLCVVADLSAIAAAALVLSPRVLAWPRAGGRWIAAAAPLAVLALALPFSRFDPAGGGALPPVNASSSAGLPLPTSPDRARGVVSIVDFVDFECPHCRSFHARLTRALELAALDMPVEVTRRMVPLPNHRGAMAAAIAWCCADLQGKGDAMAEALFAAPVAELTAEGCERIAAALGLDLDRYRADAAGPAVAARIEADMDAARDARVRALPTVWIGDRVFEGAGASTDEIVAALRRAAG